MDLKKGQAVEAKAEAREFPSGLVIISALILIAAALTYIIPGGEYTMLKVGGRTVVDPDSFRFVASKPATFMDIFRSVPKGFISTAWICFLILIVGGAYSVISNTGAIQAGLNALIRKSKGKDIYFLVVIIFLFSIVPTLMGTLEAYLAFVPLGVMIARSMKLDAIVGIAITVCAGGAGLASGITNPFNVGVAQGLVGLPVFSGMWLRILAFIGFNASVSFWTIKYALKLRQNPENSWIRDVELRAEKKAADAHIEMPEFDGRRKLILLTVLIGMSYVIYTALSGGDFKNGIPAVFLIMLFVVGAIMRYSPNEIFRQFVKGTQGVVGGVLVVGFAKAIALILDSAGIVDTIVHWSVQIVDGAPGILTAELMYLIGHITNFFIISDAGAATVLVPILSPIGDLAGITQQTVCAAVVLGGALGNMIMPTSPLTSGAIAIADIDYRVYLKFAGRIFITNSIWAAILVAIAAIVQIGPF
ncbi:YfcC family protein [uncultured Veillonella sp.]|uniref:YfcC family protein n=1 Tax=uncultured Veillonella sp. TaxID=159268 RepID=UPI0025CFA29B|nr:Na+/H+ antiporter NhaC family protein [uncultured Veillonella sp.]MDY3974225.1 Na+/H+ antiporter NhaC family protein [Veillonella caviae]